ncbi:MAG: hypothetical protein AB7O68_25565 [Pirellulales bacterium]
MHYTAAGRDEQDLSQVAVRYADPSTVRNHVEIALAVNTAFELPPHASDTRVVSWYEFPRRGTLFAMHPHMHLRGKSFRFEAVYPNGDAEILLDIPRFDFGWQYEYRLLEPKPMPEGTRICCLAHFDNSAANRLNPDPTAVVHWGDQTWDEMMIGYLHIAWPGESAPPEQVDARSTLHRVQSRPSSSLRSSPRSQADRQSVWVISHSWTIAGCVVCLALAALAVTFTGHALRPRATS